MSDIKSAVASALDVEQRTPEWFADRLGYTTASCFKHVLAKTKSGPAASRKKYMVQVALEIITGKKADGFINQAMQRGIDIEPNARMAFEAKTGHMVLEVGFIKHATIRAGASPDGLIGDECGLEIKCPEMNTHFDTLISGMDPEHQAQIQGQMWITGRSNWFFVSYDDRFPPGADLYIQEVPRDDKYIANLEKEVIAFNKEVDSAVITIQKLLEK